MSLPIRSNKRITTASFHVLHNRYYDRLVTSIAARFRSREFAEDITATAFATAYEKLNSFRGEATFYTWLFAIAMNTARQQSVRHRTLSLDALPHWQSALLSEPDRVAEALHRQDCRGRLQDALQGIEKRYRGVLVDHMVRGHAVKQIARRRRLPLGTVLSRISRGKDQLRAAWGAYDAIPQPSVSTLQASF